MEEQPKTTAGQGFGIAALILGILALLIAFIPCVGLFALIPGIIAIVLAIVGLSQANSANGAKGVIIAGLVISVIGTVIAAVWLIIFSASGTLIEKLSTHPEFENVIEEVIGDISKDIDDVVDESADITDTEDLEDTLEELEKGEKAKKDTIDQAEQVKKDSTNL